MKLDKAFVDAAEAAFESLPRFVRELPNCPEIFILEEPPEAAVKWMLANHGAPVDGSVLQGFYFQRMNVIQLYRKNIRQVTPDEFLALKVKHIVWHEIAHFLGYKEHEMEALGLAAARAADIPTF